ncbi:MAG: choice-of-anchor B family protein [Saprospiraceae bacterium]|nr:choice-of-anchor B family protein [Saprospiraceae bacterium]
MYKIFIFIALMFFVQNINGQKESFNSTLISSVKLDENANDIWGYTDENGIKYAIIGSFRNTWVYSLEDPANPILRYKAPGAQSTWRDIKSFNNHLYVTTDRGTDGLVIIDMTSAPENISHIYYTPELTVGVTTKPLERCHNLYIDEKGFCYLAGCNISKGGVLIFDLNQDPKAPPYIGAADLEYSHDAYARGDTLYTSEIYLGAFGVYDISDRSAPVLIARQTTSRNFTHNTWLSDDGKYLFTTDERANAFVDAYDISDLNNIQFLDKFRPLENEGQGSIPHNTHYFNGYLVISWYTEGLRIVDAHKPDNLVEVAYFDTWNDPSICHAGFYGCWGAFPFTGSNIVYASDINNGLYIVEVDYKRASYLEGIITNELGQSVVNAEVEILTEQVNRKFTDAGGVYKTGIADEGSFKVKIIHPDYRTKVIDIVLNRSEVTELDVILERKVSVKFLATVTDENDVPIPATITLTSDTEVTTLSLGDTGSLNTNVMTGDYLLTVSSWGFLPEYELYEISSDIFTTIKLKKGYIDEFNTDLGWTVISTGGMTGEWERAIPRQTEYFDAIAAPGSDDQDDYGDYAFVTENGQPGAACADIDNGVTTLISPPMNLLGLRNPGLNYSAWFFSAGGANLPDDTLTIKLSNGVREVVVEKIFENTDGWKKTVDLKILDFLEISNNMQIVIEASDLPGTGHIVEAGFDNFFISVDSIPVSTSDEYAGNHELKVYPNPSSSTIRIVTEQDDINAENRFRISDLLGKVVFEGVFRESDAFVDVSKWVKGIYVVKSQSGKSTRFIVI